MVWKVKGKVHFYFPNGSLVVLTPLVEETIPSLLSCSSNLSEIN